MTKRTVIIQLRFDLNFEAAADDAEYLKCRIVEQVQVFLRQYNWQLNDLSPDREWDIKGKVWIQ